MSASNNFMASKVFADFKDPQTYHDRILIVGESKFYVYSGVLSFWSEYFRTMFGENFTEGQKKEIELKELDPEEFSVFLQILYQNNSVELNVANLIPLIDLSYRFLTPNVLAVCKKFISKDTSSLVNKKLDLLEKACIYGDEDLKKSILNKMKNGSITLNYLKLTELMFEYQLEDFKKWFISIIIPKLKTEQSCELLDVAMERNCKNIQDKIVQRIGTWKDSEIEISIIRLTEAAFKHDIADLKDQLRRRIFQLVKQSENTHDFGDIYKLDVAKITYNSFLKKYHEQIFSLPPEISQFIIMSTVPTD